MGLAVPLVGAERELESEAVAVSDCEPVRDGSKDGEAGSDAEPAAQEALPLCELEAQYEALPLALPVRLGEGEALRERSPDAEPQPDGEYEPLGVYEAELARLAESVRDGSGDAEALRLRVLVCVALGEPLSDRVAGTLTEGEDCALVEPEDATESDAGAEPRMLADTEGDGETRAGEALPARDCEGEGDWEGDGVSLLLALPHGVAEVDTVPLRDSTVRDTDAEGVEEALCVGDAEKQPVAEGCPEALLASEAEAEGEGHGDAVGVCVRLAVIETLEVSLGDALAEAHGEAAREVRADREPDTDADAAEDAERDREGHALAVGDSVPEAHAEERALVVCEADGEDESEDTALGDREPLAHREGGALREAVGHTETEGDREPAVVGVSLALPRSEAVTETVPLRVAPVGEARTDTVDDRLALCDSVAQPLAEKVRDTEGDAVGESERDERGDAVGERVPLRVAEAQGLALRETLAVAQDEAAGEALGESEGEAELDAADDAERDCEGETVPVGDGLNEDDAEEIELVVGETDGEGVSEGVKEGDTETLAQGEGEGVCEAVGHTDADGDKEDAADCVGLALPCSVEEAECELVRVTTEGEEEAEREGETLVVNDTVEVPLAVKVAEGQGEDVGLTEGDAQGDAVLDRVGLALVEVDALAQRVALAVVQCELDAVEEGESEGDALADAAGDGERDREGLTVTLRVPVDEPHTEGDALVDRDADSDTVPVSDAVGDCETLAQAVAEPVPQLVCVCDGDSETDGEEDCEALPVPPACDAVAVSVPLRDTTEAEGVADCEVE